VATEPLNALLAIRRWIFVRQPVANPRNLEYRDSMRADHPGDLPHRGTVIRDVLEYMERHEYVDGVIPQGNLGQVAPDLDRSLVETKVEAHVGVIIHELT